MSDSFSLASTKEFLIYRAKPGASKLEKEVAALRKLVSLWDENLPKELLWEILVSDQCVTHTITCRSQSRAFCQPNERSQQRGRVLGCLGELPLLCQQK